jgi:hypothetical protein
MSGERWLDDWSYRRQLACGASGPRQSRVVLVVVEDKAMSVREFRDDDAGYLAWLDLRALP